MGRVRRYRERIRFEMTSVRAKNVRARLEGRLKEEYGRSRIEAAALAERSLDWLGRMGVKQLPGQVWLEVPATPSRRYARLRRRRVRITAVDVSEDTAVWEEHGLEAMQRRRLLRWIGEVHRRGGWASLTELGAWANLTPNAVQARLRAVRERGVWLPHVGGPRDRGGRPLWESWLVDRYLQTGEAEEGRGIFGLTLGVWEGVLRRFTAVVEERCGGAEAEGIAASVDWSAEEVRGALTVARRHEGSERLSQLLEAYGRRKAGPEEGAAIQRELTDRFGFSLVAAQLYQEELHRLALELGGEALGEGEMVFFAVSEKEGPQAKLAEARHVPVRLSYFTSEDLERGPYGESRTRVSDLKFGRILRYATGARAQGALLTLPDLAVLLGIHVDAIRHQIERHPEVVVPTRGRVKDIGRGITHKAEIVELYLQMHTETEIVERTGHSYESVEAYLKEFARVVTLADRGMNAPMIRRVIGRSMSLVHEYLALYKKYDRGEYHFRLAQLRHAFTRKETLAEKRGLGSSPIGGIEP
jgi:hypothetical protein